MTPLRGTGIMFYIIMKSKSETMFNETRKVEDTLMKVCSGVKIPLIVHGGVNNVYALS